MNTKAPPKILIIGGGFSGMAAAIELRKQGADVDLVEIDPEWRNYGAGISLGGPTLRTFRQLGILESFFEHGSIHNGVIVRMPNGVQVAEIPTPRVAGFDVAGGGGIMRPVLAQILVEATRSSGTKVRLGCSFSSLEEDAEGVNVVLTNGEQERYDLVVGADGLNSKVRDAVFPDAPKPRYCGQGVWRAVVPRPPEIKNVEMWLGPKGKPGVNPVSKTEMYLFINETRATNDHIDPATFVDHVKALLADFSAPTLQRIRDELGPQSRVVYRPLEQLLLPRPWFRDRIVLIGDAVHSTTPHLASGACIGIEDGIVLAEEVGRNANDLPAALARFGERRWERCRMVVENSGQLGTLEITGGDKEAHAQIMRESMAALAMPI
jgi:2-polyprenyl-6-methoxyphenol hydroxylase-like FAD-dependent oxidoreductase